MALPLQGVAYTFYLGLTDVINPDEFIVDPTIASGDFQVSIDGSAYANLTTTPVVDPAGSITVKVTLTAEEMTGEKINVTAIDGAGSEWGQSLIAIDVPIGTVETVLDIEQGDRIETNRRLIINKAGTNTAVLDKKIVGSLLPDTITIETTDTE